VAFVEACSDGGPVAPDLDVTVHFHPDRLFCGVPLLRQLVIDGVYRSQFETGTGNGGLTAYPGGDRWRWEQRMFGGAYDDAPATDRPKYGALNHRRRPAGGSVRFGSAHLRLARPVLERTTFCYPDSHLAPTRFGTARRMALVELALAARVDPLDDYVEAHVHGPLLLARDVELLVLDPSFRGTEVEAAAQDLPVPLQWHHGFVLTVPDLLRHSDFRGPEAVRTGLAAARDGRLDARIIGEAVATGRYDPQLLKYVWHCTARFGSAA
jgi:hypothetical protein